MGVMLLMGIILAMAVSAQQLEPKCYQKCIDDRFASYEICKATYRTGNKACLDVAAECRADAQESLHACAPADTVCKAKYTKEYYACAASYKTCKKGHHDIFMDCLDTLANNFSACKDTCKNPQIPEFSGIAAGIALVSAGAGFIVLRKKK